MNKLLSQKDLKIARDLYNKIENNKDNFLDILDTILDLITFIPVCINEYGNNEFELYNPTDLIVNDILILLYEYGFIIGNHH